MKKKIIILGTIILTAFLIYFGIKFLPEKEEEKNIDFSGLENTLNATTTSEGVTVKDISEGENFFSYEGQDIADIGNDSFISRVPESQVEKYKAELLRLKGVLTENPTNVDGWIGVGLIKKFFNNYTGARDAWEYAKYLNNTNSLVYYNLGNLYGMFIKDYREAEENFLKAIELEKKSVDYYIGAADFYRNFYTEKKEKAGEILEKGMREVPNDISLLVYTADYYKETGNKERALELYKKVLEFEPNNEEIKEEIESLKK